MALEPNKSLSKEEKPFLAIKPENSPKPVKTDLTPAQTRIKKYHRILWRRFLLFPFLAAFPAAILLTGINTSYDYGQVVQESISLRPSVQTRDYHVKLGWNYTVSVTFAILVSVGLFELATTLLTRLETYAE